MPNSNCPGHCRAQRSEQSSSAHYSPSDEERARHSAYEPAHHNANPPTTISTTVVPEETQAEIDEAELFWWGCNRTPAASDDGYSNPPTKKAKQPTPAILPTANRQTSKPLLWSSPCPKCGNQSPSHL